MQTPSGAAYWEIPDGEGNIVASTDGSSTDGSGTVVNSRDCTVFGGRS